MAKLISIFIATAFLVSCSGDSSYVLPRHTGAPGEIICVMNKIDYDGRAGDIIHEHLGGTYPMLPQAEPQFRIINMTPVQVNQLTQQHRNLLFVNLSPDMTGTARIEAQRNKWSSHQLVITAYASSIAEFDSLMKENGPSIAEKFHEYERNRLQSFHRSQTHAGVTDRLKEHGLGIAVPSDCSFAKVTSNFVWIKREQTKPVGGTRHDILQGVFIYHYPYTSDSAFTIDQLLSVRDSVLKEHVPGPAEGSYMTTEHLLPPLGKPVIHPAGYAVEMRGLWRTAGAVMGGPFISLTVLDEVNQRVVTAEGFVFAPKFDKREYLREVEAMVYSLHFSPSNHDDVELN